VRIFKTKWFDRFARKERIEDVAIRDAVARAERGLIDADLGGGVVKQRVARPGQGRSGGYRTLVLLKAGERAVFAYGFAKSDRGNVREDELTALRELATELLGYDDGELARALGAGALIEVTDG
jgi:hypothetical protein